MSQSIFKNPIISSAPVLTGTGNGTLTINKLTHFTIEQTYTVTCTAVAPATVFSVVGDVDGPVGTAIIGTEFIDADKKVFLTIQQGGILFIVGDFFTFSVDNGTDLNQENIDSYDEQPQKNFGDGVTDSLAGDHNLRFQPSAILAKLTLEDLEFESKLAGFLGNEISIQYKAGSVLTAASKIIQDLTFTADTAGAAGNNISLEYIDFIAAVKSQRDIQGIRYIADVGGTAGDLINITYTAGATAGAEVVSVSTNDIGVQIEDGVSTVQNIRDAILAFGAAAALVDTIALVGDSTPQDIQAQTFLQNGAAAIGDAGNEVVSVNGTVILVRMESGVSDADQLKAAIDAFGAAAALVDTVVSGTGSTAQVVQGPTNLENGADNVGDPGNEIVVVDDKNICVTFKTGSSTATQVKAAIDGFPAALALLTTTITGTAGNFQTSPVAETFLNGGIDANSFAFNKEELTIPASFHEGNADVLLRKAYLQGRLDVNKESNFKGEMSLEDAVAANLPGPRVQSVQKTLNENISNHKLFIKTQNNSTISWDLGDSDELVFTENLEIQIPDEGIQNRIAVAESPITILDGEHLYIALDRQNIVNQAPIVATTVAKGENFVRIASRLGDDLIWFDNTLQLSGLSIRLGQGNVDPEWDAVIGGDFKTHDTINEVMADPNIANIKNILYASTDLIDVKQVIDQDDISLKFKAGADFVKGAATVGLEIQSNRVRIFNGRFKDFIAGGDVTIRLTAASKNVMLRDNYFTNNTQELDDLGTGNDYIGNLTEV